MTYANLKKLTEGHDLPLASTNEHGENVIIEHFVDRWNYEDLNWERPHFRISTAQHNGWTRINFIYEDGAHDELYKKGI